MFTQKCYENKMNNESCVLQPVVYDVCLKTSDDGMDGSEVFPEYPHLLGDRYKKEKLC